MTSPTVVKYQNPGVHLQLPLPSPPSSCLPTLMIGAVLVVWMVVSPHPAIP